MEITQLSSFCWIVQSGSPKDGDIALDLDASAGFFHAADVSSAGDVIARRALIVCKLFTSQASWSYSGLLRFGFRSDETNRQVSRSDARMFLTGQYLSYRLSGHGAGPAYLLVRIPFQLFLIGWIYWATEQNWFRKKASGM